ncbi:MAG: DUF1501 domain-containing protein [Ferruginibacter sp.]|nr:DUF1501 domain-containing protein [Cytophagales bacterium]
MERRSFIKRSALWSAGTFALNQIPVNLLAGSQQLQWLAATANTDKVLVLIQLHGGNDGLNAVIPVSQYAAYYNLRPNVAIPDNGLRRYLTLDGTLPAGSQVGLHPDMTGLKALYDQGKVAIVQGVSYENSGQSHFRSRDIWYMGGDADDYLGSGWMGRYLQTRYPDYPDAYPTPNMPDPPGLEIGRGVSLAFHREDGIPTSISIDNPDQFYGLVKSVGGEPPAEVANTHYGQELAYIIGMEKNANRYAERLKEVFDRGSNSPGVTYPEKYPFNAPAGSLKNPLSAQLRLVARLLSGGCKTRIFLAKIGGFDTHAQQVESYNPTMGKHAALLYHISAAVKAFQDDLKGLGLEDRVVGATFSEFGRRPQSNGSFGTDHGTAAPMFIFGKNVNAGVVGANPDLSNLSRGNLPEQHDYRQVFTTLLQDWMGAPDEAMASTLFADFLTQKLPLVSDGKVITGEPSFVDARFRLDSCYPNPAKGSTTFSYYLNTPAHTTLRLYDTNGRPVREVVNEPQPAGTHRVTADLSGLAPGAYVYRIEAGLLKAAKTLVVK